MQTYKTVGPNASVSESAGPVGGETLRILYVGGYGRSGSTLMDMMLSTHPDAFGAGELARIFDYVRSGDRCSCGEVYERCDVWGPVLVHTLATVPGLTYEEAARVTRRVDSRRSFWGRGLDLSAPINQRYRAIWCTLLEAVAARTGSRVLVDSSKSDRGNGIRALVLSRVCGFDVRALHLVRDPRGVMWSVLKGSNRKLEAGEPAALRGGSARALVGWTMANATVHAMNARGLRSERLRYEDLVTEPEENLMKLGEPLGLDMAPVAGHLAAGLELVPGHGVSGNRLRRKGVTSLKLDAAWRTSLPVHARILAGLVWPLRWFYGYGGSS
jgi:hypothetical protein